jgi:SNF2-related domain
VRAYAAASASGTYLCASVWTCSEFVCSSAKACVECCWRLLAAAAAACVAAITGTRCLQQLLQRCLLIYTYLTLCYTACLALFLWLQLEVVPWDMVIFDEVHHLKNPTTASHKAALQLSEDAVVLGLSGTPIQNDPIVSACELCACALHLCSVSST